MCGLRGDAPTVARATMRPGVVRQPFSRRVPHYPVSIVRRTLHKSAHPPERPPHIPRTLEQRGACGGPFHASILQSHTLTAQIHTHVDYTSTRAPATRECYTCPAASTFSQPDSNLTSRPQRGHQWPSHHACMLKPRGWGGLGTMRKPMTKGTTNKSCSRIW
jgi:hypothetical protein